MKLLFILICILVLLIIFNLNYHKTNLENFTIKGSPANFKRLPVNPICYYRRSPKDIITNFDNEIIINYEPSKLGNNKNYLTSSTTFTNDEVRKIFSKINLEKSKNKYIQYKQFNFHIYNKGDYGDKIDSIRLYNTMQYAEKILLNNYNSFIKKNYKKIFCGSYGNCLASVVNRHIIKLDKCTTNNDVRYTFVIEILINNKALSHTFSVVIESIGNKYKINHIKLIGNKFSDSVRGLSLPGKDKNDKYVNVYSNYINTPYETPNDHYRASDQKNILLPDKDVIKQLKYREKYKCGILCQLKYNFSCYGKRAFNFNQCEMDETEIGTKTIKGYWDRLCEKNEECPFYKANKNYKNSRGGCNNGWCEMPLGIKQTSPHFYDKKTQPLCYNCKGSRISEDDTKFNLECCEHQKNDSKTYNKIKSPDYIFNNDFVDRFQYKKQLNKKNLYVY